MCVIGPFVCHCDCEAPGYCSQLVVMDGDRARIMTASVGSGLLRLGHAYAAAKHIVACEQHADAHKRHIEAHSDTQTIEQRTEREPNMSTFRLWMMQVETTHAGKTQMLVSCDGVPSHEIPQLHKRTHRRFGTWRSSQHWCLRIKSQEAS